MSEIKPPYVPPDSKKAEFRNRYTALAKQVTGERNVTYDKLYQRVSEDERFARKMDVEVTAASMQNGDHNAPYLLAQSPYVQNKLHREGAKQSYIAAYTKATVQEAKSALQEKAQIEHLPPVAEGLDKAQLRDRYTDLARQVTGDQTLTYKQLYDRSGQDDRVARKLDEAVVAAAIKKADNNAPYLLAQSPYVQRMKHRQGAKQSNINAYVKAATQQASQAVQRQAQRNKFQQMQR